MRLFVGLGNPGAKYAGNRHNIGFMAVDAIADEYGFSPWRKKFQGLVSEGKIAGSKILLLKPETFMNLSGQSAGEMMRFYKLTPDDVTVFHDELDLKPGKLKYKIAGGHAGHNGLRSLHAHIGENYHRLRMGVGHPGDKAQVSSYVLGDFPKAEQAMYDDLLRRIAKAAPRLVQGDSGRFLSEIARHDPPGSQRKKTSTPKANVKAASPLSESPIDDRSMLEKLRDRFR